MRSNSNSMAAATTNHVRAPQKRKQNTTEGRHTQSTLIAHMWGDVVSRAPTTQLSYGVCVCVCCVVLCLPLCFAMHCVLLRRLGFASTPTAKLLTATAIVLVLKITIDQFVFAGATNWSCFNERVGCIHNTKKWKRWKKKKKTAATKVYEINGYRDNK